MSGHSLPIDTLNFARAIHGLPPLKGKDAPTDASERASIKDAAKKAERAERARLDTLRGMMDVKEARGWIYWLMSMTRTFEPHDFSAAAQIDPLALARNAGLRELSQTLLRDMHRACPDQYLLMLRENQGNMNVGNDNDSDQ
jgi:hypothetical protein